MSSHSDPSSRKSEIELLQQLVSAALDGELTDTEVEQLRDLQARYPGEHEDFRARCEVLGAGLRRIPVRATVLSLSLGESTPGTAVVVRSGTGRIRRWGLPSAIGVAAAGLSVALLGLMISVVPDQQGAVMTDLPGPPPMPANAGAGLPTDSSRWMEGPPPVAAPMSAAPMSAASMSAAPGAPLGAAAEPQSTPGEFLSAGDWQVVVVRLQTEDAAGVRQELAGVLERHGLKMSVSRAAAMPQWLGVCIPPTLASQDDLLADVQKQFKVDTPELDPAEIMRFSRDEILQLVRQSLEFPTKAEELNGGELVLASQGEEGLARSVGSSEGKAATLLVFEFRQAGAEDGVRRIF